MTREKGPPGPFSYLLLPIPGLYRADGISLMMDILNSTTLSLEWAHDEDHGPGEGGPGEDAATPTVQLAVES
ncbi:MAG: hypothetical protein U5S82_05535 [Gammaproteobacteria bacterium]|nr:hypothetical protein [Gammaproteobacteria bacterium]